MKFLPLGDREVSVIGLGCQQFGSPEWRWGPDQGEAAANQVVNRALDLGVNFFDTAEIYGNGRSEEILGSALRGRREEAFVATKVSPVHGTRRGVADACERSLRRLGMAAVDLYQVHWPNRLMPLSWTMSGMRDLMHAGKARNIGVSNFSLRLWRRAERELGGRLASNQVQLSLLDRSPLGDVSEFAAQERRVVIAYSPLAQGLLAGRYDRQNRPVDFRAGKSQFSEESLARLHRLLGELRDLARSKGATPAQLALAWVLHITNVIAIPGARTLQQIEENAAAADMQLTGDEWERLRELAEADAPPVQRSPLKRIVDRVMGW